MPKKNKNLEYIQVEFEVKQILDEDDGFFRFEGLASTFGNIDLVDDVVVKGAFAESLKKRTPIILWQHFSDEPIGMPEEIMENEDGLFIRARLPKEDTLVKGRVIPQIKVGSIRTMSIGFRIPPGGAEVDADGIRRLKQIELLEVSLVTFPANPQARVTGFKSVTPFLKAMFPGEELGNKEKIIELIGDLDNVTDECKKELRELVEKDLGQFEQESIVTKEKLDFLDDVDDITARNLEKALRDSKLFTKNAAIKLVSFLNRSDSEEDDKDALMDGVKAINEKISNAGVHSQLKSMLDKLGE